MTTTPASRSAAALLAVAVLSGCSSTAASTNARDDRMQCIAKAQRQAKYAKAVELYRAGRLGTAAQVRADVRTLKAPGITRASFLTREGRILPLRRMTTNQRDTFFFWLLSPRVTNAAGAQLTRAESDATARAKADCPD